jgi:hypothetical protein
MPAAPTVRLTDDEIVALAVKTELPWQGPLPTLDTDSADALSVASLRGLRSLAVRDLLVGDDQPAKELIPFVAALSGTVAARTYISDNAPIPADGGTVSSFFVTASDTVVIVATQAPGVHIVGEASVAEALELIRESVADSLANSTESVTDGYSWCVFVPMSDGANLLTVADGTVQCHVVAEDGSLTDTETVDATAAIDSVLKSSLEVVGR